MPEFMHPEGCLRHEICSGNVVLNLKEHYGMQEEEIIALGAGEQDSCLLQMSDRGFTLYADGGAGFEARGESLGGKIELLPDRCGPA
jgi:hypothetical protein